MKKLLLPIVVITLAAAAAALFTLPEQQSPLHTIAAGTLAVLAVLALIAQIIGLGLQLRELNNPKSTDGNEPPSDTNGSEEVNGKIEVEFEERVETHGDFSPVVVGRDYIVNNYNEPPSQEMQRIRWRSLDAIDYPVFDNGDQRRASFVAQLAVHLHRCFHTTGFMQFTGLFRLVNEGVDEEEHTIYNLITHQIDFVGALRQSWKVLWGDNAPRKRREDHQRELNQQIESLIEDWGLDLALPFTERLTAVRYIYDPDAAIISIGSPEVNSTAPLDYPGQLSTTSELLAFLSAFTSASVVNFGRLDAMAPNRALMKLLLDLLDTQSWVIGRIRINADDYEEWDYHNPSAEAELAQP